jgi:hypothetical protein
LTTKRKLPNPGIQGIIRINIREKGQRKGKGKKEKGSYFCGSQIWIWWLTTKRYHPNLGIPEIIRIKKLKE